jgi:hypothetical protein
MIDLYLPPKPAIINAGEPWQSRLHDYLSRHGVPFGKRIAIVSEIKRLSDRPKLLWETAQDLTRFSELSQKAIFGGFAITGLSGFGVGASEPINGGNDEFTKLLLHFEGADASTTFIDSSATARTMTAVGSGQIDTAQFKFGSASGLMTSGGVSAASSADWNFGTGDFTVDFWIRFNASTRMYVMDQASGNVAALVITPSSGVVEVYGPASYVINAGSTAFNTGQWYHIALVRNGNSWVVYRDGTNYVSATDSRSWGGSSNTLNVGYGASTGVTGWLDVFRISKGIARWAANFTPPTVAYF